MNTTQQRLEGAIFLALFIATIPVANWMIGHVGTVCPPGQPCLVPVWPGIMAPSGVVTIGLALVLRDLVQRRLGIWAGIVAIAIGAAISFALAPPTIVVASVLAFVLSELADLLVYTPLQRRRFVLAVMASSAVGLVVDSVVFLSVAFGSLDYLPGQVIGKAWMVLITIPLLAWIRDADRRRGLVPA